MLYLMIYLIIGLLIGVAGVVTISIKDGFKPISIIGGVVATVLWLPILAYYLIKIRD